MVLGTPWDLHPEVPIRLQSGGHLQQDRCALRSWKGCWKNRAQGATLSGCLEGPRNGSVRNTGKESSVLGGADKPDSSTAPFFRLWSGGPPEMDLKM